MVRVREAAEEEERKRRHSLNLQARMKRMSNKRNITATTTITTIPSTENIKVLILPVINLSSEEEEL